jgi:hypothetical protein
VRKKKPLPVEGTAEAAEEPTETEADAAPAGD